LKTSCQRNNTGFRLEPKTGFLVFN